MPKDRGGLWKARRAEWQVFGCFDGDCAVSPNVSG